MSKWIKLSDQLPEERVFVLAYGSAGDNHIYDGKFQKIKMVCLCKYNKPDYRAGEYYWDVFGPGMYFFHEFEYWMSLPEEPTNA